MTFSWYLRSSIFVILIYGCSVWGQSMIIDFPLGNGTSNNVTKHPLSAFLHLRENATVYYRGYPVGPDCSKLPDLDEKVAAVTVSTWKMDTGRSSAIALLIWEEQVSTVCTFSFFGSKTYFETGVKIVPIQEKYKEEALESVMIRPFDEAVELTEIELADRYYCYYCRNNYPNTYYRVMAKKVNIFRFPDGSIRTPQGNWVEVGEGLYSDGLRILKLGKTGSDTKTCQFIIAQVKAGILTKSNDNNLIVSIPSSRQQFSISPDRTPITCSHESYVYQLHHTLGGYLISITGDKIDHNSNLWKLNEVQESESSTFITKSKDLVAKSLSSYRTKRQASSLTLFSSDLRVDLVYSQLRFEQASIIKQINANIVMLQKAICESVQMKWAALQPPNLPNKVAAFYENQPFAIGEYVKGVYKITQTRSVKGLFDLSFPLNMSHGMYQVKQRKTNEHYWAEPVTGHLFREPFLTQSKLNYCLTMFCTKSEMFRDYYVLVCMWDNISSHLEETVGDENLNYDSFMTYFKDLPIECFEFIKLNDTICDKFIQFLLFAVSDCISIEDSF